MQALRNADGNARPPSKPISSTSNPFVARARESRPQAGLAPNRPMKYLISGAGKGSSLKWESKVEQDETEDSVVIQHSRFSSGIEGFARPSPGGGIPAGYAQTRLPAKRYSAGKPADRSDGQIVHSVRRPPPDCQCGSRTDHVAVQERAGASTNERAVDGASKLRASRVLTPRRPSCLGSAVAPSGSA